MNSENNMTPEKMKLVFHSLRKTGLSDLARENADEYLHGYYRGIALFACLTNLISEEEHAVIAEELHEVYKSNNSCLKRGVVMKKYESGLKRIEKDPDSVAYFAGCVNMAGSLGVITPDEEFNMVEELYRQKRLSETDI